ncbi:MAG: O-antigen ligase family protein [Pseudobdellovibrionaceae bacterium]|nr:O-antigen ligase family protein [Pseudobdellovibrionaceae bacterium]
MQQSSVKVSKIPLILVGLLFSVYPFGPAIQNIGLGLFVLMGLWICRSALKRRVWTPVPAARLVISSMIVFLVWNVVATWISPTHHSDEKLAFFVGYAPLFILPWIVGFFPQLDSKSEQKLLSYAAGAVFVWGLVVTSQYFFPWRWVGTQLVPNITSRAQGFYSHPMSLAYASLILWPLSIRMVLSFPRRWPSWGLFLGTALMLVFSMSRIVQVLAALFAMWNIFVLLSGRQRSLVLMLAVLFGLVLAFTKNPVSTRFHHLLNPTPEERLSDYPDDRLAFWDAHFLMIQERPFLGHGIHLNLAFRKPYYERLGLADFRKQYPAHNQYLQILAEGGIVGLGLYSVWLVALWLLIQRQVTDAFFRVSAQQSLLIFGLGCLTQNAFGDSCVRMGLVILVSLVMLRFKRLSKL